MSIFFTMPYMGDKQRSKEWPDRPQPGINKKGEQMETNEVDEAIKKRPRLCWVWNGIGNKYPEIVVRKQSVHNWHRYITGSGAMFEKAELVKREEIEKYLGDK